MRTIILLFAGLLLYACNPGKGMKTSTDAQTGTYDCHVHLMSPGLISAWKSMGIPFSRTEPNYADIDTILQNNKAANIDLIGMGYVFANPEYYQGDDARQRMMDENDYLLEASRKYPERIRPFIAVDPLQDYALEELERCLKRNMKCGLKLHFNASQVYLTEPEHLKKVKPVFQKAAENQWPVLLHFDNWHPKFGQPDVEILVDSILQELPSLVVRIAHFGTSGGFNEKTKKVIDTFVDLRSAGRIPERHRLYFDISAVALDKETEGVPALTEEDFRELRQYIDKIGIKNIVFGTDYPLFSSEAYKTVLMEKAGLTDAEIRLISTRRD